MMNNPRPHSYVIEDATQSSSEALISKLEQALAPMRRVKDQSSSAVNDADRLWPWDRTVLVIAIEQFIGQHDRFPESISDLKDTGFLDESELTFGIYEIRIAEGRWEIYTSAGYRIAYGN